MPVGNGWTDTWDQTLDWQGTPFWQMMMTAVRERQLAAYTGGTMPGTVASYLASNTPTEVTSARNYAGYTPATIGRLQGALSSVASTFLDPGSVPGDVDFPRAVSLQSLLGAGGSGAWRRKAPRRIYSLSATHDQLYSITFTGGTTYRHAVTHGLNARAVGQKARYYTGIPSAALPGGSPGYADYTTATYADAYKSLPLTFRGVVEWDGAAWVQSDPDVWDVLDSDGAAGSLLAEGTFRFGDYVGQWLFDEMRTACKAMTRTRSSCTWSDAATSYGDSSGFASPWATAKANAEAAFAHVGAAVPPQMQSYAVPGGGAYLAQLYAQKAKQHTGGIYQGLARSVDWYFNEYGASPFGGTNYTFGANGYSLVSGDWSVWLTDANAAGAHAIAADVSSIFLGDEVIPEWCDEPVATGEYKGFAQGLPPLAIIDWSIGYAYP
jgi:hypothetical protein